MTSPEVSSLKFEIAGLRAENERLRLALAIADKGTAPEIVWVYRHGDDGVEVFASQDAARAWFAEHDPEGVAFERQVHE